MNRTHLFLKCKYKHMMKIGAAADELAVLHCLLAVKFHDFTIRIDF